MEDEPDQKKTTKHIVMAESIRIIISDICCILEQILHPLKYHNCKIKCTWSIILYLYGLYHLQHKFSNYTELCFPIKWEGTEIYFYVYSPPIVQILINFIICIYYLYIYVQIGNKKSIYLVKITTSRVKNRSNKLRVNW